MNFALTNSKTLWGFGIALFVLILENVLNHYGVVVEKSIWDLALTVVELIAGYYGVYGIRDTMRKIQIEKYFQESGKVQPKD